MEPGTEVAGYRIESVLGYGGMGIVYEATQLSLNRIVALKILSPQFGADLGFRERFRREGQIQAAIDHPHIVTVYEAGELPDGLFLAMRLVRGGTLKDMIVARQLEGARTLRLLKPIADALDTAHEADLIHRDIKPQNILVGTREHAYLADFGLTKGSDHSSLTKTGQFVGTIDYISPEQIRGEPTQAASDIYSLAAVLYECLAGVVPYAKSSDAAVLYAHLSDPPPRVTDQRPELPPALDEVIVRAMAKDPADRHASAVELIQEAERAFGKRVRAVITPPGPVETPEEIGLRDPESRVPTRETPVRDQPAEPATRVAAPRDTVAAPARAQSTARSAPAAPPLAAPPLAAPPGDTVVPPTPPAPAAPARGADPGRRGPVLAGAAALVALLAVAGFAAGRSGQDAAPDGPALTGSASNEVVRLSFPATWSRSRETTGTAIPGLELANAITVGPDGGARAGLTIGRVPRTGAGLLPVGLAKQLGGEPPRAERVRVGRLEALRYPALRPGGTAPAYDLILAPTSKGTFAFACYAPPAALGGRRPECTRVMRSAELTGATAVAVDPSPEYAGELRDVMRRLARERGAERRVLRTERTPAGQAGSATALRDRYAAAAQSVRGAQTPPRAAGLRNGLVDALTAAGDAYARLASAARSSDAEAFGRSARSVRLGESAVQRALAAFRGAGYPVR